MALKVHDIDSFCDNVDYHFDNYAHCNHYVNAYALTQVYGGPEEGGWWFDVKSPLASVKVYTRNEAIRVYGLLLDLYKDVYDEQRPYNSAVGDGVDLIIYMEEEIGQFSPKEVPHYE